MAHTIAHTLSWNIFKGAFVTYVTIIHQCYDDTLDSRIDIGQAINVGPGKFGKNNKPRAHLYSGV